MTRALLPLVMFGCIACASGPHPAIEPASKKFACDPKQLKVHEIFPSKVRVEGCGKDAIYVRVCQGYGMDAACEWVFKPE